MRRFRIARAASAQEVAAAASLFRRYAESLDFALCFQGFEEELSSLPGKYAPPRGSLLLAWDEDERAVGCVALRALDREGLCEMKRLYVLPEVRGVGLGRALAGAILQEARRLGHRELRLDTVPTMTEAIELYRSLGFTAIDRYYETPVQGTLFMSRAL